MKILPSPPNTDSDTSLEKGGVEKARPGSGHEYQYYFDSHDLDGVQRRLKQRHIQMIAIAGTIGTGLFLGSGRTIAIAGPLSALIAYALVGTVAYAYAALLFPGRHNNSSNHWQDSLFPRRNDNMGAYLWDISSLCWSLG